MNKEYSNPSMCWNKRVDCDNPDCMGGAYCVEAESIFEDVPDIYEYPKD